MEGFVAALLLLAALVIFVLLLMLGYCYANKDKRP